MNTILKSVWGLIDALARAVIALIGKVSPGLGGFCERLWNNTELVSYLFAGVATTLVNYVVYYIVTRPFGWLIPEAMLTTVGTCIAWVLAVLFGYVVNKVFVFHTKSATRMELLREFGSFVAMRLVSFGMELALMFLTVDILGLNDLVMKLVINILVIIANYVFSKLFIFRKK
ncbi:MAG: GtrA family protein [Clostridia bacterium]|nr:GtrA family protein [Clostridia bacterium]